MSTKQPNVGDHIRVSMHGGKIVDAVIKAIIDKTDGLHYQIDFGNEHKTVTSLRSSPHTALC
jgi:hypothetical protein